MKPYHTSISTNDSLMEIEDYCNVDFPFQLFSEDVFQFQNGIIDWHWHRIFEFKVVESGIVDCYIGTNMITLHKGDALFINSEFLHKFCSKIPSPVYTAFFSPEFLSENRKIYHKYIQPILDEDIAYIVLYKDIPWCQEILSLLSKVKKCYEKSHEGWELEILSYVSLIWKGLFLHKEEGITLEKAGIEKRSTARLKVMTEYIENHYFEKISLEDIAKSANISKSEVLRCFHEVIQSTPVKYLNQYRLKKACFLLKSSQKSMTEIAEATGFQSASYFNRMFKQAYGFPPASYRKQTL